MRRRESESRWEGGRACARNKLTVGESGRIIVIFVRNEINVQRMVTRSWYLSSGFSDE